MNYREFKNSLNTNGLHNVSGAVLCCDLKFKEAHYLLSTSGTFKKKHYIHSLTAIKESCISLNLAHPMTPKDRWWLSLSTKHVSGFSILARSYFLNLKDPLECKYELSLLPEKVKSEEITVLSLVPTQVFDLVSHQIKAPESIKYVFVGGARLNQELYSKAKSLGWPLVICYGSTETFAQMSSSEDNKHFKPYPGWSVAFSKDSNSTDKNIEITGPSVFKYEYDVTESCFKEHKSGVFYGSDKGAITNKNLFKINSRSDTKYKLKGVYYDFEAQKLEVEDVLLELKRPLSSYIPVILEEERAGARLYLVCETSEFKFLDLIFKRLVNVEGVFLVKDIGLLKSEIAKPLKTKIQDTLSKPVLLV